MVAAACNFSGEKCLDDDLESTGKSQLIDGKTNESEVIVFTAPDGVEDVASVVKNHAIAMAGMNRKVLGQHRIIPALRLKHRSGGCGTASALPKCSIIHKVLSALLA